MGFIKENGLLRDERGSHLMRFIRLTRELRPVGPLVSHHEYAQVSLGVYSRSIVYEF